eukprot:Rmarinus@m.8137
MSGTLPRIDLGLSFSLAPTPSEAEFGDIDESVSEDSEDERKSTGAKQYTDACRVLRIYPLASITQRLRDKTSDANFASFGMGKFNGRALAAALAVNSYIRTLDLSNNSLGDEGCCAIMDAIYKTNNITALDLSSNGISNVTADRISILLRKRKCALTSLSLANNKLREAGVRAIAKASETLEELDITNTSAGDGGVLSVISLLRRSRKIATLKMGWNKFIHSSTRLAQVLDQTLSLAVLDLSNNGLGDATGVMIAEVLKESASLKSIDLSRCRLGVQSCKALADAICQNRLVDVIVLDLKTGKAVLDLVGSMESVDTTVRIAVKESVEPTEKDVVIDFDSQCDKSTGLKAFDHGSWASSGVTEEDDHDYRRYDKVWTPEAASDLREAVSLHRRRSLVGAPRLDTHTCPCEDGRGGALDSPLPSPSRSAFFNRSMRMREAFETAEAELRSNPLSLAAVMKKGLALRALRRFYGAAMAFLRATGMTGSEGEPVDLFATTLVRLRTHRPYYLPPKHRVTLKIKNPVRFTVEAKEAAPALPLPIVDSDYEDMLDRLQDILLQHPDPHNENRNLRYAILSFDKNLRRIYEYHAMLPTHAMATRPPRGVTCLRQLWVFVRDCNLPNIAMQTAALDRLFMECVASSQGLPEEEAPHRPNLEVGFYPFVEATIRYAWASVPGKPTVSEKWANLMVENIDANSCRNSNDRLGKILCSEAGELLARRHRSKGLKIYRFFRGSSQIKRMKTKKVVAAVKVVKRFREGPQLTNAAIDDGEAPGSQSARMAEEAPSGGFLPAIPQSARGADIKRLQGSGTAISTPRQAGDDEEDELMNYNDLLELANKLELLCPNLTSTILHRITVKVLKVLPDDLLPQLHANNCASEIIFEEFWHILLRAAVAIMTPEFSDASQLSELLDTWLTTTLYPAVQRIMPTRL